MTENRDGGGIWQNNERIRGIEKDRARRDSARKTLSKTASWRLIAIINSFAILALQWTEAPLWNAIWMNLTGAVLYYVHERLWNKQG